MDEETFYNLRNAINELARRIGELIDLAEIIGKILSRKQSGNIKNNYKFVKSLIKPYKQPFIKIKAKARANL